MKSVHKLLCFTNTKCEIKIKMKYYVCQRRTAMNNNSGYFFNQWWNTRSSKSEPNTILNNFYIQCAALFQLLWSEVCSQGYFCFILFCYSNSLITIMCWGEFSINVHVAQFSLTVAKQHESLARHTPHATRCSTSWLFNFAATAERSYIIACKQVWLNKVQ